jgi:hypothetical protein
MVFPTEPIPHGATTMEITDESWQIGGSRQVVCATAATEETKVIGGSGNQD